MKTSDHCSIHTDLLAMDVSWIPKDLELFENEFDFVVSMVCTIARFITFVMAIIVHRAFYRLMKRLPGREINQVIYPYMVIISKLKQHLIQGPKICSLENCKFRGF